jgi:hypothetical protein
MARNHKIKVLSLLNTSDVVVGSGVPDSNFRSETFDTTVLDNVSFHVQLTDDDAAATSAPFTLEASYDKSIWVNLEDNYDSNLTETVSFSTPDGILVINNNPFPYLRVRFKTVTFTGDSVVITASGKEL